MFETPGSDDSSRAAIHTYHHRLSHIFMQPTHSKRTENFVQERPFLTFWHPSSHFEPSNPSSAPHHDELNPPPQLTNASYSLSPAGTEPLDATPPDCENLGFPRPSEIYNPWESFYPSPNLPPNVTYDVSPLTLHHSTIDPTLYPEVPCRRSWSNANIQANPIDEYLPAPSNYHPPTFPPHNGSCADHRLDYTSEPHSGTLDASASYPCLWMEGGVICSGMVQATRSNINRHLHTFHGFGGPDTRQTMCHWAGCGETMQQGSIARHMVTCHLQAKVTCPMCSKKLSRQDVISKHQRVCPAASAWR